MFQKYKIDTFLVNNILKILAFFQYQNIKCIYHNIDSRAKLDLLELLKCYLLSIFSNLSFYRINKIE